MEVLMVDLMAASMVAFDLKCSSFKPSGICIFLNSLFVYIYIFLLEYI